MCLYSIFQVGAVHLGAGRMAFAPTIRADRNLATYYLLLLQNLMFCFGIGMRKLGVTA